MKKIIIPTLLMLLSTAIFAQNVEGTWTTTMETDNGEYTFFGEYKVEGEVITGRLYSVDGQVEISNGKKNGNEFEYTFELNYYTIKHVGKLVDGELKMKSITDEGDSEFTMTAVKEE